jgi:hypothetical protein
MIKIKITFDRVMVLLAFGLSVIALIVSNKQGSAHVVVSDAREDDLALSDPHGSGWAIYYSCKHRLLLTNLGGAQTDLIGYQTTVYYDNAFISSDYTVDNGASTSKSLMQGLGDFYTYFISGNAPLFAEFIPDGIVSEELFPKLPIPLLGYNTINLFTVTLFTLDTRFLEYQYSADYFYGNRSNSTWDPVQEGYLPLKISYKLKMSSGQSLSTPRISCYFIRGNPSLPIITSEPKYWWTPTPRSVLPIMSPMARTAP